MRTDRSLVIATVRASLCIAAADLRVPQLGEGAGAVGAARVS
jgi:hypothetical protein